MKILKKLVATIATIATLAMMVACPAPADEPTTSTGIDVGTFDLAADADIYVSGVEGGNWAADSAEGSAFKMTKAGTVYTYTWTATTDQLAQYGVKFSTKSGWDEQFVTDELTKITVVTINGTGVKARKAKKAGVEKKDAVTGETLIEDNFTKFFPSHLGVKGESYTITFDVSSMEVKFAGKTGAEIPRYTMADITTVKGTVNGWATADLAADGSFEFTYKKADGVRFIYGVKDKDGNDGGKNYKVQGSECKALATAVKIKDDAGDDVYCKFDDALFTEGTTYVVTLDKTAKTCTVKAK
jgi:hypothetical protein